ncbi:MAG: helix-turn-helix transcriptional regulator [Desulfobacter sp.]|nr:helix-turn-helix transcriptional regulator [Desulfobacter sp.]WDP87632.1 MAG: helix-turn-helix transcriptional regulator [Desulfobacter sp.]
MDSLNFKTMRSRLGKTQKELAQLLGISIKAVHSYEQGWRKIPHHVERQLLFLLSRIIHPLKGNKKCWDILNCPEEIQKNCPAKEFQSGDLCWFINGTRCSGKVHGSWEDKMEECRTCKVFLNFFKTEQGILIDE